MVSEGKGLLPNIEKFQLEGSTSHITEKGSQITDTQVL